MNKENIYIYIYIYVYVYIEALAQVSRRGDAPATAALRSLLKDLATISRIVKDSSLGVE